MTNPNSLSSEDLRRLLDEATPGNAVWYYEEDDEGWSMGWIVEGSTAIFDVNGDSGQQASRAELAALAPTLARELLALRAEAEGLTAALGAIVSEANEAMPLGPFDQIDNHGQPYQSASFKRALRAGRDLLALVALQPKATTMQSEREKVLELADGPPCSEVSDLEALKLAGIAFGFLALFALAVGWVLALSIWLFGKGGPVVVALLGVFLLLFVCARLDLRDLAARRAAANQDNHNER